MASTLAIDSAVFAHDAKSVVVKSAGAIHTLWKSRPETVTPRVWINVTESLIPVQEAASLYCLKFPAIAAHCRAFFARGLIPCMVLYETNLLDAQNKVVERVTIPFVLGMPVQD